MKKFLIFLSAIIVVVCLGMTFYYFAKDEEVIRVKTSTVYLNVGDFLTLDELGFTHKEKKKETKVNFNAGGEEVESIIYYDDATDRYVTTGLGGKTTIVITTNNKRYKRFEINVHVGNGSIECPYNIFDEEDLFSIGTTRFDPTPGDDNLDDAMTANFRLMNNITLTSTHTAIGASEDSCLEFNGHFDGKYYIIENYTANTDVTYGGLFAGLGENAFIENLYIKNATIEGDFDYAGVVAGFSKGYIDRISILDSTVNNTNTSVDSYTGGVVGKVFHTNYSDYSLVPAKIYRVNISAEDRTADYIKGYGYLGGVAGAIHHANIEGVKVDMAIHSLGTTNYVGGFTGYIELANDFGFVRESLSLASINVGNTSVAGALFGYIKADGSTINVKSVFLGLYFSEDKFVNANSSATKGVYKETNLATIPTGLATVGWRADSDLKKADTYIFYQNTKDELVKWNQAVWSVVEGQYPNLKFTTLNLAGGIIDVNNGTTPPTQDPDDTPSTNPDDDTDEPGTNPDQNPGDNDNTPSNPDDKPSNPDNKPDDKPEDNDPDAPLEDPDIPDDVKNNIVNISTAEEFKNLTFQPNYAYYLTQDIDLQGATIYGQELNNSTFESLGDNKYSIKNFKITSSTTYVGLFRTINFSTVKNICIENATIEILANMDYVGIIAGRANGSDFDEIEIKNCKINSGLAKNVAISQLPQFVGGLVGITTSETGDFDNIDISTTSITGNILSSGGIVGCINPNNRLSFATFSGEVQGREYVGGIAGLNYGSIFDGKFEGLIYSYEQSINNAFFGGIAGANYRYLQYCSDNTVDMNIKNLSSNVCYYVGGIAGYNGSNGNLNFNEVFGEIYNDNNTGKMIMGGIAGENAGYIKYCFTKLDTLGTSYTNTYVGGIVGKNFKTLEKSYSATDIKGYYVGGIAYSLEDNAKISECAVVADPTLTGVHIAGLVAYIGSGSVQDCIVEASLSGKSLTNETAETAGMVLILNYYSYQKYGLIENCIISVSVTAQSAGNNYLITGASINSKSVTTGLIVDCVIDKTKNSNAKLPSGSLDDRKDEDWRSNYSICTHADQMTQSNTYSSVNFNISADKALTWYLPAGAKLPELTSLLDY